jgi:predicted CoA-substrate-specific enzyme activase
MAIGIDVGSRFLKIAVMEPNARSSFPVYVPHGGKPLEALRDSYQSLGLHVHDEVATTGSGADFLGTLLGIPVADLCKATILGVRSRFPEVRNILDIGAGSVTLIELTDTGELKDVSTNSLCAAGTGSFLDAQAVRMGVKLEESQSFASTANPPAIATRCAVFAKSDLIHRQQEGYGKEALWCGLCRGLSSTLLQTLLKGRRLKGLTVVTGGVAKNQEVIRWLRALSDSDIATFEGAEFAAALGAAQIAAQNGRLPPLRFPADRGEEPATRPQSRRPPLELVKSTYPSFRVAESWEDELGNEIRITRWPGGDVVAGYLGVDVGSTSTKAVLVDGDGSVLVDVYRKTSGDPIGATKALFTALESIAGSRSSRIEVMGCGTTGSGRKLVGAVIGADAVVNEISTHLAGANVTDPGVDTIFEIGGQDSKYIRAEAGIMRDSNMNYVCAAGTGSFVEEQAIKLGYKVDEIGDLVMGLAPPHTSDRCTVFMEQDVERLIRQGHTPAEALAAVMYSVVENYLQKVVGNRPYSREAVFFCGATARNRGLVAAFEQLLGARVVVSPYCHVLGAYGVALLTRERMRAQELAPGLNEPDRGGEERAAQQATTARAAQQATSAPEPAPAPSPGPPSRDVSAPISRFKGLNLSKREITLTQEDCTLCENSCRITYAHIQGEEQTPSWGYLCGRDPDASQKRRRTEYEPFRVRGRLAAKAFAMHRKVTGTSTATVGIPSTLSTFSHGPLWQTFLANLGCTVRFSRPTDEATREAAGALVGSEYCFPAKLAHGHVARLLESPEVEWVFMPHTVSEPVPPEHSNAFFCPVVCGLPAMARAALNVAGHEGARRLLSPLVDLRWKEKRQVQELADHLAKPLGVSARDIRDAWRAGLAAQRRFEELCQRSGSEILEALAGEGRTVILALGRAYNLYDGGANLELPLKIAEKGYAIVPGDLAPIDGMLLGPEFKNIFWTYGQRLLKALLWARDHDNVFPVWFTNFKCGPDSFLLTYAERLMGEKPFLILELDEHGGDAGYLTRIEAFLDVVRSKKGPFPTPRPLPWRIDPVETFRNRTVWVPQLHPVVAPLAAASMRGSGFDARALPLEDDEALAVGRQVTRGNECIPMAVTMGRLLQTLREKGGDGSTDALFMPTGHGPCRFGQYNFLERIVLEKEGFGELAILAPDNDNAYQGLGEKLRRRIWVVMVMGDILFKVGCRFRPYAQDPGMIDGLLAESLRILEETAERGEPLNKAFHRALAPFRALPKPPSNKPVVGVVGEIFVRCNIFSNQYVVSAIEEAGGEAWLAPFHEWVLYACYMHEKRAKEGWDVLGKARSYVKNRYLFESEHRLYEEVADLLGDRREPSVPDSIDAALPYASFNYGGETVITIGRAIKFLEEGAAMVVNCSPFGCMPGQIISGILTQVQDDYQKPVVNLFYDGSGDLNRVIGVFLRNLPGGAPTHAA